MYERFSDNLVEVNQPAKFNYEAKLQTRLFSLNYEVNNYPFIHLLVEYVDIVLAAYEKGESEAELVRQQMNDDINKIVIILEKYDQEYQAEFITDLKKYQEKHGATFTMEPRMTYYQLLEIDRDKKTGAIKKITINPSRVSSEKIQEYGFAPNRFKIYKEMWGLLHDSYKTIKYDILKFEK